MDHMRSSETWTHRLINTNCIHHYKLVIRFPSKTSCLANTTLSKAGLSRKLLMNWRVCLGASIMIALRYSLAPLPSIKFQSMSKQIRLRIHSLDKYLSSSARKVAKWPDAASYSYRMLNIKTGHAVDCKT